MKSTKTRAVLGALLVSAALPAAAQEITLQWQATALSEAQYTPIWEQMVSDFEAAHPNVQIDPILVPRKDNWTKFVTSA